MDLKEIEQRIKMAVNGYLYSMNGERGERMGSLTDLTVAYLENGGSVKRLNELVNKDAKGGNYGFK